MQFVIEEKILAQVVMYLKKRPFEEVAGLFKMLDENVKPLEIKEEPKEVTETGDK